LLTLAVFAALIAGGFYLRSVLRQPEVHAEITEEQIKQKWRELGFYCELDDEKKIWRLTGSRAGLLYFPDLLLGYVNDPANAADGSQKHYGPYGSLDIMTYRDAGLDGNAIRGSLADLERLAEIVGTTLASAQPGETVRIREEFAEHSHYSLVLDIRADGFDPSSSDRESLGTSKPSSGPGAEPKPTK
jgi:hypothetical protein